MWKPSQNRFMCFDFTKMAPESKLQTLLFLEVMFLQFFFGQVRGNLGKLGWNLGKPGAWSALIWKNAPKMEWNAVIFWGHSLQNFFWQVSGNLGKILRTPKNLPAPTPMKGYGPRAEPSGGRQFVDWKIIFENSFIVPTLLYYFYSSLNKFWKF